MRISDWSSDVCSSDLPAVEIDDLLRLVGFPPPVERHHRDLLRKGVPCGAALRQIATEPFFLRLAEHLLVLGEDVGTSGFDTVPARQLGRASCRERVCQSV